MNAEGLKDSGLISTGSSAGAWTSVFLSLDDRGNVLHSWVVESTVAWSQEGSGMAGVAGRLQGIF